MLDALETYLAEGGRFMYLGGNSLFGVTSIDPAKPHTVEVRRWGAPWPFEMPPGERYHSSTGEQGGTWKNRGRAPNTIVGMGTAGAGFDRGSPYQRMPDSYDPRASWIFDGIEGDLIGDSPNLQVKWGRRRLRVRPGRLRAGLARHDAHPGLVGPLQRVAQDDDRRGALLHSRPRREAPDGPPGARASRTASCAPDLAYLEYPNGGAVFSAGAICWRGALSGYNYENTVSQVTENVLRRFADPSWRRG